MAKCCKPHIRGYIVLAVKEILTTMLGPYEIITFVKSVPYFSRDTVSKRIDDVAADVEETLFNMLKNTEFLLQMDTSTIRDSSCH